MCRCSIHSPVKSKQPLEAKQGNQHRAGPHCLTEVRGLVGVWSAELGQEDVEDVEKEEEIRCDTKETWQISYPLDPSLEHFYCLFAKSFDTSNLFWRLGPAHRISVITSDQTVKHSRKCGKSYNERNKSSSDSEFCYPNSVTKLFCRKIESAHNSCEGFSSQL